MNDPLSQTLLKLIQQRDDAIDVANELLAALKHARDQIQHPDQMIDEAIAKAEAVSPTPSENVEPEGSVNA